jgi:hypothetical protein
MTMNKPTVYEIKVKGHFDSSWADWFDGLTIENQDDGVALITGSLPDQAALQGLLSRISSLGLTLISVNPYSEL